MSDRTTLVQAVANRLGMPAPTTVEQVNAMLTVLDWRMTAADSARAEAAAKVRAEAAAEASVAYPASWIPPEHAPSATVTFGPAGPSGAGVDYPADWNLDLVVK